MDKALYVAMTGARASLQAQGTLSHNLANSDTPGFKEALANTEAFPIRVRALPRGWMRCTSTPASTAGPARSTSPANR